MTYAKLKTLTQAYLIGDNKLPPEPEIFLVLTEGALLEVATRAESLHLMTLSKSDDILRLSYGEYMIRRPESPVLDSDHIDIDEELVPVVARLIASSISKEKGSMHAAVANRLILDFNAKTYDMLDTITKKTELEIDESNSVVAPLDEHGKGWGI